MLAWRTGRRDVPRSGDALSRWAPRLLPFLVYWFVTVSALTIRGGVITGILGLLALPVLVTAARRVETTLLVLVAVLPFHVIALSWLYSMGLSPGLTADLRYWRDLLVVAVLLGVLVRRIDAGHRMDALDRVSLAYIAFVAAYAIAPRLFAADAPLDMNVRFSGLRQNAGFLVLFFAARRAPLTVEFRERFVRTVLIVTVVVGALAVFEFFNSSAWNDWMVDRLEVQRFRAEVLGSPVENLYDVRFYGDVAGREIVRTGGVLLSPLTFPFYMVPGFVLGLEHLLRGRRGALATAATALAGLSIVFTQTRSAVLTTIVALVFALRLNPPRAASRRSRLTLLLAAALIVSIPIAAAIGLVDRVRGGGDSGSATIHHEETARGWETLAEKPFGLGLGTSAGAGQRYDVTVRQIQHNSYLQIGNETGVISLVLLAVVMVFLGLKLRQVARDPADELSTTALCGLAGFAVGSWLLQPFVDLVVSWQYFLVAGVAVAVARVDTGGSPDDDGESRDDQLEAGQAMASR